jgi:hypothetical protein
MRRGAATVADYHGQAGYTPPANSEAVGRESEAHPAFRIISSPDAERHHLPPPQGHKYRIVRNCESLSKANPQPCHLTGFYGIVVEVIHL